MINKIVKSLDLIEEAIEKAKNPAVLCSFGKDSISMLHLVLRIKNIPVLYFKEPFFPKKNRFANQIAEEWDLSIYDYPPSSSHTLQDDDWFEVINLYNIGGKDRMFLPTGIENYKEGEKYLCTMDDFLKKPTGQLYNFPWDVLFIGHKSSDINPFTGQAEVIEYNSDFEHTSFCYPIRDWTDEDVWNYIRENNVPYNDKRYGMDNKEYKDTSYNEDYFPACYKCLDYKENESVLCPKTNTYIKNVAPSKKENEEVLRVYKSKINNLQFNEVE